MINNNFEIFKKNSLFLVLGVLLIVLVLDQISKILIVSNIEFATQIPVIDKFFNLTLAYNKGAAFGIFADIKNDLLRHFLLGSATSIAIFTLLYLLINEFKNDKISQIAVGLILGGALGNITDRIRIGHVVDFLDFYYGGYHWPAFNVADSAICIGVFLLVIKRSSSVNNSQELKAV